MTPYEYLLSESQERMLFVVKPGTEHQLITIFLKWGLTAVVVGKVLKDNVVRVLYKNKTVVNLPASALADDTPIDKHTLIKDIPKEITNHWKWKENQLPLPSLKGIISDRNVLLSWNKITLKLLDNPSISSKSWIYNQYDYQVQNNTIIPPGQGDAAVVRLRPINSFNKNSNRGIAAVVDCPNRWVALDPERGSIAAVAEASRNISCVGALPLAVTDNLNFSSPNNPFGFWQLSMSCKGLSTACKYLETPVTGGNVSLFNETRLSNGTIEPIQPTPVVGMVGLVDNLSTVVGNAWKDISDTIWLLGLPLENLNTETEYVSLSASIYLETIFGLTTGRPPKIDLNYEKLLQTLLRKLISNNLINSSHDVSDGGLIISLAECSIASNLGINCILPETDSRIDRILFGESGSRILVSISQANINSFKKELNNFNIKNDICLSAFHLGEIISKNQFLISMNDSQLIDLSIPELKSSFKNAIPRRIKSKE